MRYPLITKRIRSDAIKCLVTLVLALLLLNLLGCGGRWRTPKPARSADLAVSVHPVSNTNAIRLTVDDVIVILRQLGHTDEQVFELGEDLRDALLNYGGAKIRVGDKFDSALRAEGFHLWIFSLSRGTFVYDVKSHEFTLGPGVTTY